jgi:hypothetical protein
MSVRSYHKYSCGCRSEEIEYSPCLYHAAQRASFGEFSYGMRDYIAQLDYLRGKCTQASQEIEVAVSEKCSQCLYEDLVRSMAEGNIIGEENEC